jgi:hypothetical protein
MTFSGKKTPCPALLGRRRENGACPAPFPGGVPGADSDVFQDFLKNKGLHILHANIRSLLPKVVEVKLILQRTSAAVLAITETWLDSTVSDNEIDIDRYSVLCRDRNRHGDGVCFYICNKLAFNLKPDLSSNVIKFLTIELLLPKTKPFLVTVTYRPPQDGKFLGAKSTSIRDCVRPSVRLSVRPSVCPSVRPTRCDYVENAENVENAIASRRGEGRGN